jgi:hypothetical protein
LGVGVEFVDEEPNILHFYLLTFRSLNRSAYAAQESRARHSVQAPIPDIH